MANDLFEEIELTGRLIEEHFRMVRTRRRESDLHEGQLLVPLLDCDADAEPAMLQRLLDRIGAGHAAIGGEGYRRLQRR